MADLTPWCICCGRTKAICKRDKGCSGVDPTIRRSFYAPYYEGGTRVVVNDIPCRMGPLFKVLPTWAHRQCLRGTITDKEQGEAVAQFKLLIAV